MKIYLASSFNLVNRIKEIAFVLQKEGHEITVPWWNYDFKAIDVPDSTWYNMDKVKAVKERNFKGIDDADVLILVCPSDKPKKFNGANIELGYAIGKGKTVMSIGLLERSAMYHGVANFSGLDGLLTRLKNLQK